LSAQPAAAADPGGAAVAISNLGTAARARCPITVRLVLALALALAFAPSRALGDSIWCGTPWGGAPRPITVREELVQPDSDVSGRDVSSRDVSIRGVADPRLARALRHAVLACPMHGTMHVRIAVTSDGVAYALGNRCLDVQLRSWRLPPATDGQTVDAVIVSPASTAS
jgi:hypothetical protein